MIEKIISIIADQLPPSSGDNLLGFNIDCDALITDERFTNININQTIDLKNMIEIIIQIDKSFSSIQELSNLILSLYLTVGYKNFSSHGIKWSSEMLTLRFITIISEDEFYVSGTIKVIGDNYRILYNGFKRNFIES